MCGLRGFFSELGAEVAVYCWCVASGGSVRLLIIDGLVERGCVLLLALEIS